MIKYNPPKLSLVYHFDNKPHEQYYHDIHLDKNMLESYTTEDVVSHLFVTEAYYFNPK